MKILLLLTHYSSLYCTDNILDLLKMKKIIFPIFFSITTVCFGQIPIGQSDMPSAGDTLRVSNTTDTINPALTGPNYTWNYSFLKAASQWVEKFDNPSSFTFPFNLLFNVFNTSYGQKQYTPDSIPGLGISMGNAYGFFKKSSTSLKQIGQGLSINGLPVPFQYSSEDYIYRFPLNYGNIDSSDSQFGPPSVVPLPFYYGQKIHRVNEVDGWGTLTTPFGTFSTLRVKSTLHIRDTIADSSGIGFAFARPTQYEYKWLKQGGKIPYLQINATDIGGFPVVTKITYRDSLRSGTIQIGINEVTNTDFGMQLFPNPANDFVVVQYQLANSESIKFEILDITGKTITTIGNSKSSKGLHVEVINLKRYNLSKGIYFVSLNVGAIRVIKKLVIN